LAEIHGVRAVSDHIVSAAPLCTLGLRVPQTHHSHRDRLAQFLCLELRIEVEPVLRSAELKILELAADADSGSPDTLPNANHLGIRILLQIRCLQGTLVEEDCTDGIDNDQDCLTDMEDDDCQ